MANDLTNFPPVILAWMVGWKEILIILAVILLLFGGKKLPELARGLARGLRSFRDELKGVKKDLEEEEDGPGSDEEAPDKPEPREKPGKGTAEHGQQEEVK